MLRNARAVVGAVGQTCLILTTLFAAYLIPLSNESQLLAQPGGGAAGKQKPADESEKEAWNKLIYIPYRNLRETLAKNDQTKSVVVSLDAFMQMLNAMNDRGPRVTAVITQADYIGKVDKDLAMITARYSLQVLGKPWVEVPLRFGDAAVGKFTPSDPEILLRGDGNGGYTLLIPKAGTFEVTLELAVRVRTSPEGRHFEFECPATAITNFNLSVPSADQTVEVTPHLIVTPDEKSAEGTTVVSAQIGATGKIGARWFPRVSTAPVMELLTSVNNVLDVRVADGLVHSHAVLNYQVLRGGLEQIRIAAPIADRVLDVAGQAVKSWRVEAEEKRQVIVVDLLSQSTSSVQLNVRTERDAAADGIEMVGVGDDGVVFGIHAADAARESGVLVVGQAPDLSLNVERQVGLVRVEAAEAPETLRRPEALYFKFFSPKATLRAQIKPVDPRLLATALTTLTFTDDELKSLTLVNYTIERAGVFELRFALPKQFTIDRVDCDVMKEFQTPAGTDTLIVLLREKTQGSTAITIRGHVPLESVSGPLPILEPQGLTREEGKVFIFAPNSLEVIVDTTKVVSAQPERGGVSVNPELPNVQLASAWTYNRRPIEIPATTRRKPTRIYARAATTIAVAPDHADVESVLNFDVQYAGIDTVQFAVPESVAAQAQIDSLDPTNAAIKQKTFADAAVNGLKTCTVVLQRDVTGTIPIRVKYSLPFELKGGSGSLQVVLSRLLPAPGREAGSSIALSGITGEVLVRKDRTLDVQGTPVGMEDIDLRELTQLSGDGALAYRYFRQPEEGAAPLSVTLSAVRHEVQDVVKTVVHRALIEVVLTEQRNASFRTRFLVKSSERQRLPLNLPTGAEPLDVQVAGKSVPLEKAPGAVAGDWQPYTISVARSTSSDVPFVVAVKFNLQQSAPPLMGWGGAMRLLLPRLGDPTSKTEAVAVQHIRTAVWVPDRYWLVNTPVGFTVDRPVQFRMVAGVSSETGSTSDLDSWFGSNAEGLFDFQTSGHVYRFSNLGGASSLSANYWRSFSYTTAISIGLAVIAFVLAATSWSNRLTVTLFLASAAAVYAVYDREMVMHALAAARIGIALAFAVWITRSLLTERASTMEASPTTTSAPALNPVAPTLATAAPAATPQTTLPPPQNPESGTGAPPAGS